MSPDAPFPKSFDEKTTRQILLFSGLVSLVLMGGLTWFGIRYRAMEHFDAPEFLEIREEIKKNPTNEKMIEAFRLEDRLRREEYFASRHRLEVGGFLLLVSLSIFVLALRRMAVLREELPVPLEVMLPEKDGEKKKRLVVTTLVLPLPVALGVLICFSIYTGNGTSEAGMEEEGPTVAEAPPEDLRWNQLRGNQGLGIADDRNPPIHWDTETGDSILWKAPVPLKGNSSPIVWGDFVFLTGATADERKIFCFDVETGDLLWERAIQTPVVVDEEMKRTAKMGDTGFASPTPVTDGKHVIAFFGTNEIAAVDFSGEQVWSKWLGKPNSLYGIATSPCLSEDRVLLQLDQGSEEEPLSALYAFHPLDGRLLWKTEREVPAGWSSPIVVDTGERKEILTAANPWVISYNPINGTEWWRARVLSGDVAPIPAYGGGLVFTAVEYSQLAAVETGGTGDVTGTHVRWTYDEELPDIPSPVSDGRYLLLPTSYGYMVLFDAQTGENLRTEEFEGEFWSSPIVVGDKVFLTDTEGKTVIFRFAPDFERLGGGTVGERVVTTPAFIRSRILIRGEKHLYCIGSKPWPSESTKPL